MAENSHHFPYNLKRRNDRREPGIFGFQTIDRPSSAESFDGPFSIGSGSDDDLARASGTLGLHDHQIAIVNSRANHGVARDLQQVSLWASSRPPPAGPACRDSPQDGISADSYSSEPTDRRRRRQFQ